jgi:hypothetical protein
MFPKSEGIRNIELKYVYEIRMKRYVKEKFLWEYFAKKQTNQRNQ